MEMPKSEYIRSVEKGHELLLLFGKLSDKGKDAVIHYGQGVLAGSMLQKNPLRRCEGGEIMRF